MSASGTAAAAANGPAVTLSPNPMYASSAPDTGTTQVLTITNSGNAPLIITSYTFGTGNAWGYGSDCIGTIQPGNNCTQNISFHPSTVGTAGNSDSFVIHDNATPPQQTVTLIGTGLGPLVSLDGTSCPLNAGISCDTVRMLATGTTGTGTSTPQTVTLTNTGTGDLYISNVQVNGGVTGFSKVNDTCLRHTIQAAGT